MLTESIPSPNSVLSNFIIAMGHPSENSESFRSLLSFTSIQNISDLNIPIQIACDFKVAAILVGIQQASSKHPCPFCIWRKDTKCTGTPSHPRRREEVIKDLHSKNHSVSHEPIIWWSDSPMETLALALLHILLGLVNRLYSLARPTQKASNDTIVYLINNTVKLYRDAKYIGLSIGTAPGVP